MVSEIVASQLSHSELERVYIGKLNELRTNYQLQGNYKELTANYIIIKKDIEIIKSHK